MARELIDFDIATYLSTPEDRAEYINAVIEDGTAEELGMAIADVARAAGLTEQVGHTGAGTISTTLSALGLRLNAVVDEPDS